MVLSDQRVHQLAAEGGGVVLSGPQVNQSGGIRGPLSTSSGKCHWISAPSRFLPLKMPDWIPAPSPLYMSASRCWPASLMPA